MRWLQKSHLSVTGDSYFKLSWQASVQRTACRRSEQMNMRTHEHVVELCWVVQRVAVNLLNVNERRI
jgi:hypothetical protein